MAVPVDGELRAEGDGGEPWPPAIVRAERIAGQVALLAEGVGLARVLVSHPQAPGHASGFAPGIQVSIEVLAGHEATCPRRNSASLCFGIGGRGEVAVDGRRATVGRWDTWTVPPMAAERHRAVPDREPFAFLRFSNAALLELLGVHWQEPLGDEALDGARPVPDGPPGTIAADGRVGAFGPAGPFRLEYERLVDPPWVGLRGWVWPWSMVRRELDQLDDLDDRYAGRRVCLLYDPATGRTNGTTFTLFASMCTRPAGIVDPPHRHTAAAVNYFFEGEGWSTIGGERVAWRAGDLVFAAPGWTTHHHASGPEPVHQLAVQDNPLHLAMGSLLWQERLGEPPKLLGAEPGYTTNRHELAARERP